jgi:hypothetical protein
MERIIRSGTFTSKDDFLKILEPQLSTRELFMKHVRNRNFDEATLLEIGSVEELLNGRSDFFLEPKLLEKKVIMSSMLSRAMNSLFMMNWVDEKLETEYNLVHSSISADVHELNGSVKFYDHRRFYALMPVGSAMVSFLDVNYGMLMRNNYSLRAVAEAKIIGPLSGIGSPLAIDVKNHFAKYGLQLLNDKFYDYKMNNITYVRGSIAASGVEKFIRAKKISAENIILRLVDEKASREFKA